MTEESQAPRVSPDPDEKWPIIKAQPRSFFKAPLCIDMEQLDADVAFIGVPFDQGTFGRPGARFGPDAIRDAPRAYSYADPYGRQTEAEGFFDIDTGGELLKGITMADCGNITVVPSEVTGNFDKLTQAVEKAVEVLFKRNVSARVDWGVALDELQHRVSRNSSQWHIVVTLLY